MTKNSYFFLSLLGMGLISTTFARNIHNAAGKIDRVQYSMEAFSWDKKSVNEKLGPTFKQLSPTARDTRPTAYKPTSKTKTNVYARINPWEFGEKVESDGDYWADSGQVGYVADDPSNPGLDRVAFYAYNSKVFAVSPRLDRASGKPSPDPQTREPRYVEMNGEIPKQPVGMARGTGLTQNEAIVVYRDGLLAVAGTQTSRAGNEKPYPGFMFPEHKIPTGVAITTNNEFAVVTIWDIQALKGQLAVVALEGKYIKWHTTPYIGFINQGSWSDFKLLGYVDLPMAAPSSVSVASNGYWNGPSSTSGKNLGQLDLSVNATRDMMAKSGAVAKNGYAIVASKQENKVAIVDLTPLFTYIRDSWLSTAATFKATLANRGSGDSQFPQVFSVRPSITPKVIWQATYPKPTAVLAGQRIDRWSTDRFKAYVATEEGNIHIIDTSSIMARSSWHQVGKIGEMGSFFVGANPVDMTFARRAPKNLPLVPSKSNSGIADCFNSVFWVAVRGEQAVKAVHSHQGQGQVHMTIRDSRMSDPVAVTTAVRGPIISVADFSGKKILSFRVDSIVDARNKITYKLGPKGTDQFEFAGELEIPGNPFLIGSANVN
jgi:hypothetical protein